MTEMFRSELQRALSEHRLIDPSGWMDDNGRVEYECRCGEKMHETPRTSVYLGGDAMLAAHQAEILDQLGYRRAPDALDAFGLDRVCTAVVRRRIELGHLRETKAWSMSPRDRNRLNGAHAELEALEAILESVMRARLHQGEVELPLAETQLAVA